MRRDDGNALAIDDGAKNRAVEVIEMHRCLAAPSRLRESEVKPKIRVFRSHCEKSTVQASHGPGTKSSELAAAQKVPLASEPLRVVWTPA
jgi:hypothetical protein